jgi:putative transposase
MARAKRHYIPGNTWHITHRCHKGEFLLKFARDKRRWIEWLYQSKKRYQGLSVLDYMVTSNHIHLLVSDTEGYNVIPDSIKLVAGRTAQEYNMRKKRKGAFWEDRYHAVAVDKDRYLRECIAYIDLNMVRAGVVSHPSEWEFCGYNEIQNPRQRKGIIDFERLMDLVSLESYSELKQAHFKWVNQKLYKNVQAKEERWTKGIAVGSKSFVENVKDELGFRAIGRKIVGSEDIFELREIYSAYGEATNQSYVNEFLWL